MKLFVARVIQATLDAEIEMSVPRRRPMPAACRNHRCLPSRLGPLQLLIPADHSTQVLTRFSADEEEAMRELRTMLLIGHLSAERARSFAARLSDRVHTAVTAAQLAMRINGEIAGYMRRRLEEDFPFLDSVHRRRGLAIAWSDA